MTNSEFEKLTQVVTYDDWVVSTDNNGRYYVKDAYKDWIKEVTLVHKEKNDLNSGKNVVDFGGDYDGESDDAKWLMSFNIIEPLFSVQKEFTSLCMKQYFSSCIIQNDNNRRAWLCSMYDSAYTMDEAKEKIEKTKKSNTVLCAWVEDEKGNIVFHECYVNVAGQVKR